MVEIVGVWVPFLSSHRSQLSYQGLGHCLTQFRVIWYPWSFCSLSLGGPRLSLSGCSAILSLVLVFMAKADSPATWTCSIPREEGRQHNMASFLLQDMTSSLHAPLDWWAVGMILVTQQLELEGSLGDVVSSVSCCISGGMGKRGEVCWDS